MNTFDTLQEARYAAIDISLVVKDLVTYVRANEDKTFSIVRDWCPRCVTFNVNGNSVDHVSNTAPFNF